MRRTWRLVASCIVLILAVPAAAYANAGVPMLGVVWPGMGVALIPVILLETYLVLRALGLPARRVAVVVGVANVASTLVGIPLTWAALVGVQAVVPGGGGAGPDIGTIAGKLFAVTVQAPWLIPYDADLHWMIPTAALVLLVPFFFASWCVEYLTARLMLRDVGVSALSGAVFRANLVSYALLGLVVIVILAVSLIRGSGI
ncbi:MAG: hypothetical protein RBS78_08115 [Coriobacteriia bacterium]|nr:hypothetical protein [Coriobacteriia bacterium]